MSFHVGACFIICQVRRPHGEGEHVEVEGEQIKPSNSPETAKESQKQQKVYLFIAYLKGVDTPPREGK